MGAPQGIKNIDMPTYPQVHIRLHKYILEDHTHIYIFEHINIPNTDAHKCSLDTHRVRAIGLPESSLTRTPSSLRVPESAAPAVTRPSLEPPAPHPEQLESAWWCTQAGRWVGRGRQQGPGRGPARRSWEALSLPRCQPRHPAWLPRPDADHQTGRGPSRPGKQRPERVCKIAREVRLSLRLRPGKSA